MSTVVVGLGNPERGDDAAGLRVVEGLRSEPPAGVRLATATGDLLRLLDVLDGAGAAVLVDATRSGAEPGTVRRLDASTGDVTAGVEAFASSHTFDLAATLELGRSLGRLPPRLVIYGIEAGPLSLGGGLSPAVEAALDEVITRVREECACTRLP